MLMEVPPEEVFAPFSTSVPIGASVRLAELPVPWVFGALTVMVPAPLLGIGPSTAVEPLKATFPAVAAIVRPVVFEIVPPMVNVLPARLVLRFTVPAVGLTFPEMVMDPDELVDTDSPPLDVTVSANIKPPAPLLVSD